MDAPFFSHFRLPLDPSFHSQRYPPAIAVADVPLDTGLPRCVLRGSLDPTTGIFYRTPEHTRIRTSQACDKCRVRKAKCSGDHPVCERCHVRGLICRYAPERRSRQWSKTKAEQDGASDRSAGRPDALPPSSDVLQPGRPRSKSGGTSTSHKPSVRQADADRSRGGGEDGDDQHIEGTAPRARPRRATIASTAVHAPSSPDEGAAQSEPFFLQHVLDLRCPDRSRKGRDHPVSGSRCAVPVRVGVGVAHEALGASMVCGGADGQETLEAYLDPHTPRIEENALALSLNPYTGGPSVLLDSLTGDDMSRVTLSDPDPGAEYPEGVDGTQRPMLLHHPPRFHWSGSCFDMSSVDLSMISNDERPSLCPASDVESPDQTPSTSSSASPDITRTNSDGLPTTPTNSYPNSPFTLTSLGPFVGDPNAYALFPGEVDMGTDGQHHHYHGGGMLSEYVEWREAKDGAHAFGGNLGLFVDMDPVF